VPIQPPPAGVWQPVERFAPGSYGNFLTRLIFGVRDIDPIQATSWWRSPNENRDVGGFPESQHLLGLAVDLVLDDKQRAVGELVDLGLTAVNEGTHVHVQYWPAGIASPLVRFIFG